MVETKGFFTGGEGGFFSPVTTDENNERYKKEEKKSRLAQAETTSEQDDFQSYIKAAGIRYPRQLSPTFMRMLKENYRDDKRDGFFKDGQFINKAPEQNILQRTGTFLANIVSPPAVAGTLEGKPTRFAGQASPIVQRDRQAVERSVRQQTGMQSNPGSQRQTGVGVSAGNLSRHSVGSSASQPSTTSGINRSQSRRSSRSISSSRGQGKTSGVSRGSSRSNTGSKSASRGASGSAGSRSRGGTGPGRTSTSRTASKASRSRTGRSRSQCDIRTKIDINPLTNNNLIRDDLANVAYFVLEIK